MCYKTAILDRLAVYIQCCYGNPSIHAQRLVSELCGVEWPLSELWWRAEWMSDGQNRTPVMCVREMSEDVEGRRERMRGEGEKCCLQLRGTLYQVVQYSHCCLAPTNQCILDL